MDKTDTSIIAPECKTEDVFLETTLRPKEFKDYIGQYKIKESLSITIEAAKSRGEQLDHLLFHGPAGLGKTTLAHIVTHEMKSNIKVTSGPALERAEIGRAHV